MNKSQLLAAIASAGEFYDVLILDNYDYKEVDAVRVVDMFGQTGRIVIHVKTEPLIKETA
jgi:hypothetical protein